MAQKIRPELASGILIDVLEIDDGVTAPGTVSGKASIYVDTADGSLKVKFDSGNVKTLATDS